MTRPEQIEKTVDDFMEFSPAERAELWHALKRAEKAAVVKALARKVDPNEVVVVELEPGCYRVDAYPVISPRNGQKTFRLTREFSQAHMELILPRKRRHAAESEGATKARFEKDVQDIEWLLAQIPKARVTNGR